MKGKNNNKCFLALAIIIGTALNVNGREGVIITNKPAFADRFAKVILFSSIDIFDVTVTVGTEGNPGIIIPKSNIREIVEFIPESSFGFINDQLKDSIIKELDTLKGLKEKYSAADSVLDPRIERLSEMADRLSKGEVYSNGKWQSKVEYDAMIYRQRAEIERKREMVDQEMRRIADEKLKQAVADAKIKKEKEEQLRAEERKQKEKLEAEERAIAEKKRQSELGAEERRKISEMWELEKKCVPTGYSDKLLIDNLDQILQKFGENSGVEKSIKHGRCLYELDLKGIGLKDGREVGRINDFSIKIFRSSVEDDFAFVSLGKGNEIFAFVSAFVSGSGTLSPHFAKTVVPLFSLNLSDDFEKKLPTCVAASMVLKERRQQKRSANPFLVNGIETGLGKRTAFLSFQEGLFWKKQSVEGLLVIFIR